MLKLLSEVSTLRMENELLKELNAELKDKNKLLHIIVNRNNSKLNELSYASVTKNEPKRIDKVRSIYVKSKVSNKNPETFAKIKNKLNSGLAIAINMVKESWSSCY